nr:hypothetical protein C1892_09800 [Pseudomonas sp. MPBD7-1]
MATWDHVQKCCVFCDGFGTLARLSVMAVVRGRPSGLPVPIPVRQPACNCHPIVWRRLSG